MDVRATNTSKIIRNLIENELRLWFFKKRYAIPKSSQAPKSSQVL